MHQQTYSDQINKDEDIGLKNCLISDYNSFENFKS